MKKFLAMLLAAVMLFAFAACGGSRDNDDDDKDNKKSSAKASAKLTEKDLEGEWILNVELDELVDAEALAEGEGITEKEQVEKYVALYDNIDISFKLEFDGDDFEFEIQNLKKLQKEIVETLTKRLYFDGLLADISGMTQADLEDSMKEQTGKTLKETVEESLEALSADEIVDTCDQMVGIELAEFVLDGEWKYDDDKIIFTPDDDYGVDQELYIEIEFTKEGFIITEDKLLEGALEDKEIKK